MNKILTGLSVLSLVLLAQVSNQFSTQAFAGPLSVSNSGARLTHSNPFSEGKTNLSFVLGSGSTFNDDYIILGAGIGYYLIDGLEVGIDAQYWFSGNPSIIKVSPQLKYVFLPGAKIRPYVGAFYRRTFVDSDIFRDQNSYGSRAGAYFTSRSGVYIGAGVVYEKFENCRISDCSNTYPEFLISISL